MVVEADGSKVPATLIDVARRAGVHPSTASRALNGHSRSKVSPATVAAVLDAARRLDYQPNTLARGLKMSRTFTVGMLVPDLTNPLFPPIVRGLEDRLREAGWTLVLANTDNDDDKERSLLQTMTTRRVDGLVLATARRSYPLLAEIERSGLPTVLVNRTTDEPTVPAVLGDDHNGIGQAVRHLASLGHTKIAFVGGTQEVSTGLVRYHSFVSWMHSAGLDADPERIVFARWFREDLGADAFEELIRRGVEFTAVVCGNDLIALGGYTVLRATGAALPRGRLDHRLQRHPLQRQVLPAVDQPPASALRDRPPRGGPADRGHRGAGSAAGGHPAQARADGPRVDGTTTVVTAPAAYVPAHLLVDGWPTFSAAEMERRRTDLLAAAAERGRAPGAARRVPTAPAPRCRG